MFRTCQSPDMRVDGRKTRSDTRGAFSRTTFCILGHFEPNRGEPIGTPGLHRCQMVPNDEQTV